MITVLGKKVSIDDVLKVKLEQPERAGSHWEGIPHKELLSTLKKGIQARKWEMRDPIYALSNDGAELACACNIIIPDYKPPKGQILSLGLITSNNRRRSLKLLVGTNVKICSNGFVSGEVLLKKKHTTGLDLESELDDALTRYRKKVKKIKSMIRRLKEEELEPIHVNHILMCAGRTLEQARLAPWSMIGKVDKEFRNPTVGSFTQDPTSWGLLMAFTHCAKQLPPLRQLDAINRFRSMLPCKIEGLSKKTVDKEALTAD